MVEIPGPSENLGKSPGGDRRHSRLLADFLFGDEPERADSALDRLRVDNNRRSLGMTEQERGTAEVLDWAKENGPGIAREGAMIVGPAVLTAAVWETVPQSHRAVEMAVVSGLGVGTLMTLGGEAVRRIAELHPRLSKFAEAAAVVRSVGLVFTQISASAGIGMVGAELADRFREAFKLSAAAQMGQTGVTGAGGGNIGGDYYHSVSDVNLPQPQVEQAGPPKLPGETADFLDQAGHTELTEAQERLAAEQVAMDAAQQAEAARQAALEAATRVVEVQPNDNLTTLVARAGGDPYGADFTNTVLQSADVLTGPQNPNRDMARALVEFAKTNPGVNWRDAINGVGSLAKEIVGGVPLKEAIAQATRMIYPGQEMKIVVGAGVP